MGKEVSYCQNCGERLGVGDAAEHQVWVHEGRRFCAACRPAQATTKILLPDRRKSSTKVRAQAPAPPRVKETTRIRKRSSLPIVLAAAAVGALGIGIAIVVGSGSSEPAPLKSASASASAAAPSEPKSPPKPDPGLSLDELLRRIRELRQSDLMFERREDVQRLLAEAAAKAGSRLEEVDLLAAEYDRKFEEAASRLADFTRSEAARMAAKQKYAEAIGRLDAYPAAFQTSRAASALRALRDDYARRQAEAGTPAPGAPTSPRRVL